MISFSHHLLITALHDVQDSLVVAQHHSLVLAHV